MYSNEIIDYIKDRNYTLTTSDVMYIVKTSPQITRFMFDCRYWKYWLKANDFEIWFDMKGS